MKNLSITKLVATSLSVPAFLIASTTGAMAAAAPSPDETMTYEINPSEDLTGFVLDVSGGASVKVNNAGEAAIIDAHGNTLEELPAQAARAEGENLSIKYAHVDDDSLFIQYSAGGSEPTITTATVRSTTDADCYIGAAGALLSTAGVLAAIPTGGASLWIAYAGTVVSHAGAIYSCA